MFVVHVGKMKLCHRKGFRKCMPLCPRFMTPEDTHDLCVVCLGAQHSRSTLEGVGCIHCDKFTVKKLRSRLALCSRDEGQVSAYCRSGPVAAEAALRI